MTEKVQQAGARERYFILDLVRGVVVFLMILAHSVFFIHNGASPVLSSLEKFGNFVAFTTFLIVSGASTYIAYFKEEELKSKKLRKRVGIIVLSYFALAFFVGYPSISGSYGVDKIAAFLNILTLRNLPSYTEFIVPFFLFPTFLLLFPDFFKKLVKSVLKAVLFSLVIYFLGMIFYRLPVWEFTAPWKALLAGNEGFYRFPIMQYFPVYVLGLAWGHWLVSVKSISHQKELSVNILVTSLTGFLAAASLGLFVPNLKESLFLRWPPSIPFILFGASFCFLLATLFYLTKRIQKLPLPRDFLLILGQNAFALTISHILILNIYGISGIKTGSFFVFATLFLMTLVGSLALATFIPFNLRFRLNFHNANHAEETLENNPIISIGEELYEEAEKELGRVEKYFFLKGKPKKGQQRLAKKRHLLGATITLVLASFVTFPPLIEEFRIQTRQNKEIAWWNDGYGYRQELKIKNTEKLTQIPQGEVIAVPINMENLVANKKLKNDITDLAVVYTNGNKNQTIDYKIENGELLLKLKRQIRSGEESRDYFIYYGNFLAQNQQNRAIQRSWKQKYTATFGAEEEYPFLLSVEHHWNLIGENPKIQKLVQVSVKTKQSFSDAEVTVKIDKTLVKTNLTKTGENIWEGSFSTKHLKPGKYTVTATIKEGENFHTSQKDGFYLSYPLYVAWTQDWEGYDVPDGYLTAIARIADKYGAVMTHMFNPRLYTTTTVSQERKDYLTNWIKNRNTQKGEGIELHLHMFYDYLEAVGVTPIKEPNWGDNGDGYGSLTTNYPSSDIIKLLNKAFDVFDANGLPRPTVFRAGGWFANLETLKALEEVGIKADSSGRTAYNFYSQKGPWELASTAQPYYPSKNNQNRSDSPTFNILELPNNGADSYWFSTDVMQNRFKENYNKEILTEPKEITYLSHPHWFKKEEQQKIESLFELLSKYTYENDNGPVIYVTLSEMYEVFK